MPRIHFSGNNFHIMKLQSSHFSFAAVYLMVFCFDSGASYALRYTISATNNRPVGTYPICSDRDISQMTFASRKIYFVSFNLVPYYVLNQI